MYYFKLKACKKLQKISGNFCLCKKHLDKHILIPDIYLFKINNGKARTIRVSNKDTRTTSMTGVFVVNFGQISYIVLVLPLLTLKK